MKKPPIGRRNPTPKASKIPPELQVVSHISSLSGGFSWPQLIIIQHANHHLIRESSSKMLTPVFYCKAITLQKSEHSKASVSVYGSKLFSSSTHSLTPIINTGLVGFLLPCCEPQFFFGAMQSSFCHQFFSARGLFFSKKI